MSDFIVSARKYRPATFRSVVGQKHITSTLQNAIERGQLAHAYLFCGPRGVGKTTCARIFAKAINCLAPDGAEACNECESCRSFNEGRSLNIHELDAASNNSVEDIRTLIEQVRIIPQVGRYSVFIIDEVHMLSAAAFNAFLKTLEEPPAHAIFILATTEKHKIIPTILSRCQIYDFNRIRVEDSVEYLKYIASQEGISADEESLNLIAQKADGGMRDALSMFDKAVSFCGTALDYRNVAQTLNVLDYDTYFSVTEMLLAGNYVDVLVAFDSVLSKGFSGQTFMSGMNRHMRDLLMARQPDTLRLIEMTGTLLERYRTQAGACSVEFLFGAISVLTELDGKIRQSSNQRLLVELGLMKIAGLGQKKNDTLTSSGEYPLPELTPRTAAAAVAATPAAQPQPAPATRPGPNPVPAAPQQSAAVTRAGLTTGVRADSRPGSAAGRTPAGNAGAIRSRPGTRSRSGRTARSVQTRAPARAEAADLGNLPFGTARLGGQQSGRGAFRTGNGRTGGRDDRPRVRTETGTRPGKDPEPHPGTTSAVRPGLRTDEGAGQHDLAERADERTARRDTPQQDRDADAHRRTGGHHGSDRTGSGRQRGNSGRTPDQTRRPGEIHDGKESADRGTPQSIGFGSGIARLKSGIYGRWSVRRKQIPNCASTEKQSEN